MLTGSLDLNCEERLVNLYSNSHSWLIKYALKLTKQREEAEDLVGDLYEYLNKKCNEKIFWGDAYHMFYCYKFLESRWINKVKKLNKVVITDKPIDTEEVEEEYDIEGDMRLQHGHDDVINELKRLSGTKMWASARIFEIYWMSTDKTLDEVAKDIKISKSTVFLAVRKIRRYLKEVLDNPFE
jgi:DNA-directed RNA polymerase specialized sigma24 family protein